jgi:hypothetical protein
MFFCFAKQYYAVELFVKKGPLGKMWIAGTVGWKKLSKIAIVSSNIEKMAETIMSPPVPLALPTQATLLRGVCRIQSKQCAYLLTDALDAQTQLHVTEKASITIDVMKSSAKFDSITMKEANDVQYLISEQLDAMAFPEGKQIVFAHIIIRSD